MRLLERVVEKPHSCTYLPSRQASLEVQVLLDVTAAELEAMLERGWRRFGPMYFRPACTACGACISLRLPVARFSPSKSQKRAARACASLRRVVGRPLVDGARLDLYARWHAMREEVRGWEPNPQTRERYAIEFAFAHPAAREAAFYDEDRLVGVGLFDETPRALSAAFFFYDPEYSQRSLGTANVLSLVDDARATGRDHVYLGYCVEGCASLAYKAGFKPHELLEGRPSMRERPAWKPADL
jgi:arginine-tRNA-protein transferase